MMGREHLVPLILAVGLVLFVSTVASGSDTFIGRVVASIVPSRTLLSCTDTDGGNDYKVRGEVKMLFYDGSKKSVKDRCVNGKNLYEYNCPIDNSPHYETRTVRCLCRDGRCQS